jgi:hypothetical protein
VKTIRIRTLVLARMAGMLLWRFGVPDAPEAPDAPSKQDARPHGGRNLRERGDVPGWVMITLMSAVLVAALLALAGPALEGLFNQAMQKVGQ